MRLLLVLLLAAGLSQAALIVTAPATIDATPGLGSIATVNIPLVATNTGPTTYNVVIFLFDPVPTGFTRPFATFGRLDVGVTRTDFIANFEIFPTVPAGLYTVSFQGRGSNTAGTIIDFSDPVTVQVNLLPPPAGVPEPASVGLMGLGIASLAALRRKLQR